MLLNKMKEMKERGVATAPRACKDNSTVKIQTQKKHGTKKDFSTKMINDLVTPKPPSPKKSSMLDKTRPDETSRLEVVREGVCQNWRIMNKTKKQGGNKNEEE